MSSDTNAGAGAGPGAGAPAGPDAVAAAGAGQDAVALVGAAGADPRAALDLLDGPSAAHPLGRPVLENVLAYLAHAGCVAECPLAFGASRAVWRTDSQMHWALGRARHGAFRATRLHWACRRGLAARAAELVDVWHSPLDAADAFGMTPLHVASANGHLAVVRELLARGAAVGAADAQGDAPLHHASSASYADVARALLDAGADVNARGEHDLTPLHYASTPGGASDRAANRPVRCEPGPEAKRSVAEFKARAHAKMAAKLETAQLLLERGADVNALAARNLFTPLLSSSGACWAAHVRLLLAAGADAKAVSARGGTSLHFACEAGDQDSRARSLPPARTSTRASRAAASRRSCWRRRTAAWPARRCSPRPAPTSAC